MSNAVAVMNPQTWSPEQMKLITDVVARGASQDELKLFLYRCQHMGLDPLKPGMVHFVKYGNGPGTIIVGIEGFRSIAGRTGKLSGVERGVTKDEKGNLVSAWAKVHRSDWKSPAHEEVPFEEYNTGKGPWAKMPQTMLKKVAEAAALRMAFPDDLGGVYTKEEMDQAEPEKGRIYADQPPEDGGDGVICDSYRVPFGKFGKRTLEEIDLNELRNYVTYLENKAAKENKKITGMVADFIERACAHIVAFENSEIT